MKIPQPNLSKNPAGSQPITSAIYIRASATKYAENQLSKLRGFAERQGWLVLEYQEEVTTKMAARRPVLAQLLDDAKEGKFQVVICWRIDRFGPSIRDWIDNIAVLIGAGVRFVCHKQPIDTAPTSFVGTQLLELLMSFGQSVRILAAERIRLGVARALREQAAAARAGRTRVSRSGKNLPHGAPRKIWQRGRVVELRAQGMSLRKIAAELGSTYGSVRRALKANCDADALTTRAAGKQANGDLGGAIADFTEAIQRKPDHAPAYRGRGLAKRAQNNMDGANADFAQVVQLEKAAKENEAAKSS
jgi:DNA invertase Pin-like site-specific DNA recombinase